MAHLQPRPTVMSTPSRRALRHPVMRTVALFAALCTVVTSVCFIWSRSASADAGFGVGLENIATNGFTHPWMGGYQTDIGTAFCIETANGFPRAVGNSPAGDLPKARGVSLQDRKALAYALWAYTSTTDNLTAAGLAVVAHGLSGDVRASTEVAAISVSNADVHAAASWIAAESEQRAYWVSDPAVDPWKITTTWEHVAGVTWTSHISVTTADGAPITHHRVEVVPTNVSDAPGASHAFVTDDAGRIEATWTQSDRFGPVAIEVTTSAPTYYRVWKGPDYPGGTIPQRIITPTSTTYRAHAQAILPTGKAQIRKVTANPAYQSAQGATYDVADADSGVSRGTLTVGADGRSNVIELPIGAYTITETTAPDGVGIDPNSYGVTLIAGQTTQIALSDPVEKEASIALVKLDARTSEPVAGATLVVARDADDDGTFETTVGTYTSAKNPIVLDGLAAGTYRITETVAPSGYLLAVEAFQVVTLAWNSTATVTFADHRIPPPPPTSPPTTVPPTTRPPTTTVPPTTAPPSTTTPPETRTPTTPAPPSTTVPHTSSVPPSTSGTPSTTITPPAQAPPTHGGGGTPPPGRRLPLTGASTGLLTLIALVCCAGGLVLFAARRRHGHTPF